LNFSLIEKQLKEREAFFAERRMELESLAIDITENEKNKILRKSAKGLQGFWFFAKKVFPEYFKYPFGRLHKRIIKSAFEKKRVVDVFAAPPEHGKTTLLRIFKIWAALFGYYHYFIKVTETDALSALDLSIMRLEFEENPRINFLFGNLKTKGRWEEKQFVVAPTAYNKYGAFFEAFAFGIPPTGRVWKQFRPDFCDIDDLENYRKSANPDISREKLLFIQNDIIPRVSEKGHIIWFGNNARKTMAINMIIEMNPKERKHEFPAFRLNVFPAWNRKKNEPEWTERFGKKYKSEEEMRIGLGVGTATWLGNYQQTPVIAEGTEFRSEHWRTYSKLPRDAVGIMFCDPASGKTGCYKAIAALLYSKSKRKFYSPTCYVRQSGWEPYFKAMYEIYESLFGRILWIGWEKNFHQEQFLKFMQLYPSVKDLPRLPIRPIDVTGNKDERIRVLAVPYEFSHILFAEDFTDTADGAEAKNQLIGFPDHPYKDWPDALASAYNKMFAVAAGFTNNAKGYESLGKLRTQRI